jgi:hypothetical protein
MAGLGRRLYRGERAGSKAMKTLAVTVAGLALAGVTGANAQDYPVPYGALYPYAGLYMAAPVGVGPVPVVAPAYGGAYVPGPYPGERLHGTLVHVPAGRLALVLDAIAPAKAARSS